jgi:hypothetical protein
MSPLSNTVPLGAFTNLTVAAINAALVQAGVAATTGNVFYCDPANGLDSNDGQTPVSTPGGHGPTQTLGAGYNLLRSGFNDVLVLIGNGTTSASARLSATFTWSKNAAHLFGICAPSAISQRARIAPFTASTQAAFANFFVVSGNGCLFQNVSWFQGFTAGVAASICLTVSGTRNAFVNCDIEGMGDATSAASATSRNILLKADENYFLHCNVGLDTVTRTNANASIELQSGAARNIFENCTFLFYSGDGACLGIYTAAAAAFDRFLLLKWCTFINAVQSAATAQTALATLAASSGGAVVMKDCMTVGITTIATDATSAGQIYAYGPTGSTSAYLATSVTS